jgi:hypothetical protein
VRGDWLVFDKIEELVHRADDRVRLALAGLDTSHPRARGLDKLVERRREQGLEVQALAADPVDRLDGIALERVGTWPFPAEIEIDGRETFRVIDASEGREPWGIGPTLPADVERPLERFDEREP